MRVIAGKLRGRPLRAPRGLTTRPTADRAREAIFQILGNVSDLVVVDLYAGTGAMGIEALSRGAARAVFVESDAGALRSLKENLTRLGITGQATVLETTVERARPRLTKLAPFDLVHARAVLMHLPSPGQVVARLARAVRPGGVLVLEDHLSSGSAFRAWEKVVSPAEHAAALTRVVQAVEGGFRAVGANPEFALDLPAALIAAGQRDVNAELTSRLLYGGTDESAFYTLSLRQLGSRLVGAGLLDPQDAEQISAFTQEPASRWLSLAMVTAWGWRR